jgi:hypothetical protein
MPAEFSPVRIFIGISLALIGILLCVGLAIPGSGPRKILSKARVVVEIKQLESAIASFKSVFGKEPPSRIILHERPTKRQYDLEGKSRHARIEQRTVAYFQAIWPNFPVLTCQIDDDGDGTMDRDWVDFNSNGKVDDELDLDGAECLVFFLGGIVAQGIPIGFNKMPNNPFSIGGNRVGPFHELSDTSRLIDRDGDGFLELIDSLKGQTVPYLYFSTYDGAGYNFQIDCETADNGAFQPYYSAGDPRQDRSTVKWYKPYSFQIISPGKDRKYGVGGILPLPSEPRTVGREDRDNFTNFTGHTIDP